jgi:hypothetical protein
MGLVTHPKGGYWFYVGGGKVLPHVALLLQSIISRRYAFADSQPIAGAMYPATLRSSFAL